MNKRLLLSLCYLFSIHQLCISNIYTQNNNTSTDSVYILGIEQFLMHNPEVMYKKCFDPINFSFKPFPFSINHNNNPNSGYFRESFIVTIPHALVQSCAGFVIYQNQMIKELVWKERFHNLNVLYKVADENILKIEGKVAVIAQPAYQNYWHWLTEVLCRLALLELYNIEYDFLVVGQEFKFMQETLRLWGVDENKIIAPLNNSFCIQADEVIAPSITSNISFGFVPFSCYAQPYLLRYVQKKLLTAALNQQPTEKMCKRIFISRKDSHIRNITSEDEIFDILQPYGFERYQLAQLSVVDQIHLFNQAEIIISPQGTGLANIIFCNKKVKIIELFQGLNDATFWYLSQELGLSYNGIKTIEFIPDYMTAWQSHTYMDPAIIQSLLPKIVPDLNLP